MSEFYLFLQIHREYVDDWVLSFVFFQSEYSDGETAPFWLVSLIHIQFFIVLDVTSIISNVILIYLTKTSPFHLLPCNPQAQLAHAQTDVYSLSLPCQSLTESLTERLSKLPHPI